MDNTNRHHVTLDLEPISHRGQRQRSVSPRPRRDVITAASDAEPLVGNGFGNGSVDERRPKPPKARPETVDDDDVEDDIPYTPEARPGVDDSFFPKDIDHNDNHPPDGTHHRGNRNNNGSSNPDSDYPSRRPSFNNFPYAPEFGPGMVNINGVPTEIPDVNVYQHKKTLAQGMMDLALLSANANQLRYILESYRRHPYFYVSLILLSLSLFFQVAVGVGLILNSKYNVKDQREICKANRINNFTVIGIFIVTVVNVFISAFGVADPPPDMNA